MHTWWGARILQEAVVNSSTVEPKWAGPQDGSPPHRRQPGLTRCGRIPGPRQSRRSIKVYPCSSKVLPDSRRAFSFTRRLLCSTVSPLLFSPGELELLQRGGGTVETRWSSEFAIWEIIQSRDALIRIFRADHQSWSKCFWYKPTRLFTTRVWFEYWLSQSFVIVLCGYRILWFNANHLETDRLFQHSAFWIAAVRVTLRLHYHKHWTTQPTGSHTVGAVILITWDTTHPRWTAAAKPRWLYSQCRFGINAALPGVKNEKISF